MEILQRYNELDAISSMLSLLLELLYHVKRSSSGDEMQHSQLFMQHSSVGRPTKTSQTRRERIDTWDRHLNHKGYVTNHHS